MQRRDFLKTLSASAVAAGMTPKFVGSASAQSRSQTLIVASEAGPNALDGQAIGANRSATGIVWNTYDRLVSFEVKRDASGDGYYDYSKLKPEAAEDIDLRDMSMTMKLRKDMNFHDGSPVTAKDVKYTFERALGVGGYPTATLKAASLTDANQCVVVDDRTVRFDFIKKDKLSPIYLGVGVLGIYNSELVKKNSTPQDVWGQNWTKSNLAGSGAYLLEKWTPGQEVILAANPNWKSGPPPQIKRVIWRVIPSASTRRALLEKGDIDVAYDLPANDYAELGAVNGVRIYSVPMENTVQYLGMNVEMKPFDDVRVRQAIAYAVPYKEIIDLALFKRGKPLFGGPAKVTAPIWPQAHHYVTDLDKAKKLLTEAGYPDGFDVPLSFDLGTASTNEPLCILVQEQFAKLGIRVKIDKVPSANWRPTFMKKQLPLQVNIFGAWFNFPDYFFHLVYSGENTIFNTMSYKNAEMDKLIEDARFPADAKSFDTDVVGFVQKAFDDVPNIPLFQPYLDIAMRSNVSGYTYWFHREVDYRSFRKA